MKAVDVAQNLFGCVLRPGDVVRRVAPARDPPDLVVAEHAFQTWNASTRRDACTSAPMPEIEVRRVRRCGGGDLGPERVGLESSREHETRGYLWSQADQHVAAANQRRRPRLLE